MQEYAHCSPSFPCTHIHAGMLPPEAAILRFMAAHGIKSLNVADSRGSKAPGVYDFVMRVLSNHLVSRITFGHGK